MDDTAAALAAETERWRERLDRERPRVSPAGAHGEAFLTNLDAYRRDADHFEREGDLVRAFECIVWAWAWLEIGAEHGVLSWRRSDQRP